MSPHPFLTARWRHLVLLTFEAPEQGLVPLVPPGCEQDRWRDRCHVSLVALRMERVRVRGLAVPGLTAFAQVNLRLYVRHVGRPAVRFVQELVPSRLLAAVARWRYGEPFAAGRVEATLSEDSGGAAAEYGFGLDRPRWLVRVQGSAEATVPDRGTFEHWVKERVRGCGVGRNGRLHTFDVTHPPWAVRHVKTVEHDVDFAALYGPAWSFLNAARPVSVLYAVGSVVTVSVPS